MVVDEKPTMSVHKIVFCVSSLSGTADQLYTDTVVLSITTSGGSLVSGSRFNEPFIYVDMRLKAILAVSLFSIFL